MKNLNGIFFPLAALLSFNGDIQWCFKKELFHSPPPPQQLLSHGLSSEEHHPRPCDAGQHVAMAPSSTSQHWGNEDENAWSANLHFCFVLKLCSGGLCRSPASPATGLCAAPWCGCSPWADTCGTAVPLVPLEVPRPEGLPKELGSKCIQCSLQVENKTSRQWGLWF